MTKPQRSFEKAGDILKWKKDWENINKKCSKKIFCNERINSNLSNHQLMKKRKTIVFPGIKK